MSCVTRFVVLRGTTAERLGFTPLKGELVFDCDTNMMYVGDGTTPGGIHIAADNLTSLSMTGNILTFTDEQGNNTDVDLSVYLDDTNLARLTSGVIDPATGIGTFTRDDNTTFTVDFSSLIDLDAINQVQSNLDDHELYTQNELDNLNLRVDGVQSDLNTEKADRIDGDDVLDARITAQGNTIATISDDLNDLEGQVNANSSDITDLQNDASDLEDDIEDLETRIETHELDLNNPHQVTAAQIGAETARTTSTISDWDLATDTSVNYHASGNALNGPAGFNNFERGYVHNYEGGNADILIQEVFDGATGRYAVRRRNAGNWSAWAIYADTVEVQASIDAGDSALQTQIDTNTTDIANKADLVHNHVEADITDLDKYTQAQVDSIAISLTNQISSNDSEILALESDMLASIKEGNLVGTDLVLTNHANVDFPIDLSNLVDNTNLSRVVSGDLSASGILTLKRDDSTFFDTDLSSLISDPRLTNDSIVDDLHKHTQLWNTTGVAPTVRTNSADDTIFGNSNEIIIAPGLNPRITIDDQDTSNNAELVLDNTNFRIDVDNDNARDNSGFVVRVDADVKLTVGGDDVRLHEYTNTRDDGVTPYTPDNLYVDSLGVVQKGVSRSSYISNSGRIYMYADARWICLHDDLYGSSYFQMTESAFAGANPVVEWEHNGNVVLPGSYLKSLTFMGRAQNVQVTDFEISIMYTTASTTNTYASGVDADGEDLHTELYRGRFQEMVQDLNGAPFGGNMLDKHMGVANIDFEVPEHGEVRIYIRPIGNLTGTRFFYGSWTWEMK